MKYALNLSNDGRILSATFPQYASNNAVIMDELPEGNIHDYRLANGIYIYDPLPVPEEPDPEPSDEVTIEAMLEVLTGVKA